MPQPIYNFSTLTPEVQRWLYQRICAFDLATNFLAQEKDDLITSTRMAIFMQVYQTIEADDHLNIVHLEITAMDNNLARGAFNQLVPSARWVAMLWAKAFVAVATEVWAGAWEKPQNHAETLTSLLAQAETLMIDHTPEEIACYFAFIDRWEPRTPFSDMPLGIAENLEVA